MSVILFHSGFEHFKGGYLGVDIFFVISGFLITSIILNSLKNGTFSFSDFYGRRAKRLLPALMSVMVLCILPAWLLLLPDQMHSFATSLGCAAIFLANIFYMMHAGYFSPNSLEDPLIHLWTLSIEEQFYLIAPALILVIYKRVRWALSPTLVSLIVASIAYANYASANNPDPTFFNSAARAWELLVGCLTASLIQHRSVRSDIADLKTRNIFCIVALSSILFCITSASENTSFPSLPYYVTILSTAVLLWLTDEKTLVGKLLSYRYFVYCGLISYSLYLWHQPILAFSRIIWNPEQFPMLRYLSLILTFCAAHFSWKFVENPLRHKSWQLRYKLGITLSILGLFLFGVAGNVTAGFEKSRDNEVMGGINAAFTEIPVDLHCLPSTIKSNTFGNTDFCKFGDHHVKATVAIFGDSHSHPLRPVFDEIGRERKIAFIHNGIAGCPPLVNTYIVNSNYPPELCYDLVKNQVEFVRANGIRDVFLVARWSLYTDGSYRKGSKIFLLSDSIGGHSDQDQSRKWFRSALYSTIDTYESMGVNVHILTQAPMQLYSPKQVYRQLNDLDKIALEASLKRFSVPYSIHSQHQKYVRSVFTSEVRDFRKANIIDLDNLFCDSHHCFIGTSTKSFYSDDDHLSSNGAMYIKPVLVEVLSADGR